MKRNRTEARSGLVRSSVHTKGESRIPLRADCSGSNPNPCCCMREDYETARSRNIRTLLVHDSPKMLKALSQILASEVGFTVMGSATDGCQALRHASAFGPDLILIGEHLTKLTSAQVTGHFKRSMNPPVVFLVSQDNWPSSRALSEGATADSIIEGSPDIDVSLRTRLHEWFSLKTPRSVNSRKARQGFGSQGLSRAECGANKALSKKQSYK